MNNLQLWQAIGAVLGGFAALLGGLYLIVTRPLLKAIDLGFKGVDARFKAVDTSFGGVNHRLEEIEKRLGRIEEKLENHTERITRLEERTSPLHR